MVLLIAYNLSHITKHIKTKGKDTHKSLFFRKFALTITILYDLRSYEGTFDKRKPQREW